MTNNLNKSAVTLLSPKRPTHYENLLQANDSIYKQYEQRREISNQISEDSRRRGNDKFAFTQIQCSKGPSPKTFKNMRKPVTFEHALECITAIVNNDPTPTFGD